jgi:hypothetical protein
MRLDSIKIGDNIIKIEELFNGKIISNPYFGGCRVQHKDVYSGVNMTDNVGFAYNEHINLVYIYMDPFYLKSIGKELKFIDDKGNVTDMIDIMSVLSMVYSKNNDKGTGNDEHEIVNPRYSNVYMATYVNYNNDWELDVRAVLKNTVKN